MAGLLVSVRSVPEARVAVAGGASVVDVKEPDRGPLGRADFETWAAIRRAVAEIVPVSVALGELVEWASVAPPEPAQFERIAYRKLGLSAVGADWRRAWADLRRTWGRGPSWVAVSYADWARAGSPHPDEVLDVALEAEDCAAILVDTWDKTRRTPVDASWGSWFERARRGGVLTALAGGLDVATITRLAPLRPDLFAVRGAACVGGERRAAIDPARVSSLVLAARSGMDDLPIRQDRRGDLTSTSPRIRCGLPRSL